MTSSSAWTQRRDDVQTIGTAQAAIHASGQATSNEVVNGILNSLAAIAELGANMEEQLGQTVLEAGGATHAADTMGAVVEALSQQLANQSNQIQEISNKVAQLQLQPQSGQAPQRLFCILDSRSIGNRGPLGGPK